MPKNNGFTTYQGKIVCPRCDGNGLIYKAQIAGLDNMLLICDECEAYWEHETRISMDSFSVLGILLKETGRSYKDITDLGYYMVE